MPKHPPERYEPGELDRTRENLGDLTPEEAKRMAALLGGEVGVERITPEMEEKYHRLQMLNRRTSDPELAPEYPHPARTLPSAAPAGLRRHAGWSDRIRINFWASGPEYRVLPRLQAFRSLISFLFPHAESIHPAFINRGDQLFYHSVERLVLAIRSLLSINRREEVPSLTDPTSLAILDILREWDIETIHRELSVLQRAPRRQPFSAAARLCRALYRPFFLLIDLDPQEHLIPAVKRLFDLDLMAYPPDSREASRIKRMGSTIRHELLHLFTEVRRRCIPLLVKLADIPYAPYPQLLRAHRAVLLEYLALNEEELLAPGVPAPERPEEEGEPDRIDEGEASEQREEKEEPEEIRLPDEAQEALQFLVRLFPQSGFEDPSLFPDLFGYFKSILAFPKNTDLLHPRNPVHQIGVLLGIIQEFLYGFRQIIFGEVMDQYGEAREIQPDVDRQLNDWHRLLDELVCGRLLTELVDYCRQVERSPEYRHSETGIRQENAIMLRIRRTLLPHLEVTTVRGLSQPEDPPLPRLHTAAAQFSRLLGEALMIDPEGTGHGGIRNPNAPFHFEIETFVTLRFRKYLQRKGLPQDNRHLVIFTARLIAYLEYLLNNPESHLYESSQFPLYRHEEGHREIPIYTVPEMETVRIIEGSEMELTPPEEFLEDGAAPRDKLSGLRHSRGYRETIEQAVETYHREGSPVTVATLTVPSVRILGPEEREDRLRVIGHCVRGAIREYSDLPFRLEDDTMPLILPETGGESALAFCRRLMRSILEKLPEESLYVGITQYHPTWSSSRLIKNAARTAAEAERRRPPVLLMYRETDDAFEEFPLRPLE